MVSNSDCGELKTKPIVFQILKTKLTGESLVERRNVEDMRAQRVWRLVNVQLATWVFFALFFGYRGFLPAVVVSTVEIFAITAIHLLKKKRDSSRVHSLAMNLSLAATAIGLVLVSLSHPHLYPTMLFFPISIVIASQLLGIRAAFSWLVITILAQGIFHLSAYGTVDVVNIWLDDLALRWGVAFCLFFCCHQGEVFYQERTRGLMNLSDSLRLKSQRLHELATTDSLTGLLNRHQLQVVLKESIDNALAQNKRMALLLIDMDRFKEINDTLGHHVGDLALMEIAERLTKSFPQPAQVARLGGDEFCIIIPETGSPGEAAEQARMAFETLTERYIFEEFNFSMGASVGVALCPDDTEDATSLLAFADTAMFCAKESHSGVECYSPSMTNELVESRELQDQLDTAVEREEFFLVYQPQVCVSTGTIIGVEALLRWECDGEIISPARFTPLLERNRKIIDVGKWVVRESCRQLKEWNTRGIDLAISINLSSVQFNDPQFNQNIERPIRQFDIDARQLDFEITESLLIEDVEQAVERLRFIKKLGANISIDDFGTGYSSLAYLRQFPLDRLKIDRDFVKDYPGADDGVIASSIVALGKAIGLKVIAEGVETSEQLTFLKSLDCDEYQGYLFSKPLSADGIEQLIKDTANDSSLAN